MQIGAVAVSEGQEGGEQATEESLQCQPCDTEEMSQGLNAVLAALNSNDLQTGMKNVQDLQRRFNKRPAGAIRRQFPNSRGSPPGQTSGTRPNTNGQPNTGSKFPYKCHHCGKPGHKVAECRQKTEDVKNGIHKRSLNEVEVAERTDGESPEAT